MEEIFDKNIDALRVSKKYISQTFINHFIKNWNIFLLANDILFCNLGFASQG